MSTPDLLNSDEMLNKAIQAFTSGKTGICEKLCKQILELDANHTQGLHILGLLAGRKGDVETEVKLIQRAISFSPDDAELHNNLGTALHKQGKTKESIAAHNRAIELRPQFHEAHNNLGTALNDANRLMEAEQAYEHAIKLTPKNIDYRNNLALCLHQQGRSEKAAACLQHTLTASANANLYHTYGLLMARLGDNDAAIQAQLKALELEPRNMRAWQQLVLRSSHDSLHHLHIKSLQQILAGNKLRQEDRMFTLFALGKCYDECGHYETAFRHIHEANKIMAARHIDNMEKNRQQARAIKQIFSKQFMLDRQLTASGNTQPLFILGMSRTGKTTLEKLLAMHPDIHRGGELYAFPELAVKHMALKTGGFPEAFASQLTPGLLQEGASQYRRFTHGIAADARFVTDTLNRNAFYLGVIAMLFPDARVIWMRRDPLDTLVSIYFKWFGNTNHYAYRLDNIRETMAQNDVLMAHWKQALPIQIFELDYETLVSSPADSAARVAEYCGLCVTPALKQTWSETGIDERWIGHGRHYREYIDNVHPGLSNFRS